MTNAEKFKTILERRYAYGEDCRKSGKIIGEFSWLEMEYKEELRLLPCPFCGGAPVMADNIETMRSLSYFVRCACGTRTVSALSESAAAEIWNRRVKMSELVKLIGAMAERGWVYSSPFNTYDSLAFTHTNGEIKKFRSWDEVAEFVENEK